MAKETLLTELVDPKAFDQLIKLNEEIEKVKSNWLDLGVKISSGAKTSNKSVEEAAKSEKEFIVQLKESYEVQNKLVGLYSKRGLMLENMEKQAMSRVKSTSEQERLQKRFNKTLSEESKEIEKLSQAIKKNQTNTRNLVREQNAQAGSVEELRARVARLKQEWSSMDKSSPSFLAKTKELRQANKELASLEKTSGGGLKSFFNGIGNSIKGAGLALVSFAALFNIIKNGISTIVKFEQANADLATILGKSRSEITELTNSAKELGSTTEWMASQVTQLQTELAKLGFDETQIMNMQTSILQFATATGADLPAAAALAGASLRMFNGESKETERYVSAMAVGTNKSALSFSYLDTAMSTVGPVADKMNLGIEDTISLLGVLSNSGFDASTAATSTRNILLSLSDASGKLSTELGKPVKSFDDLVEGFDKLSKKGLDLGKIFELTDKRTVSAMATLISGAKDVRTLRGELDNLDGELERIQRERLNTVEGSVKLLNSAWESLMLSFSNSTGVMKMIVNGLTGILNAVNSVISGSDNLVSAYERQTDKAVSLEANMVPLLKRYDELKSKGELNTDQQEELKSIIEKVSGAIPGAITEFDRYGKAMDINSDKAYEFVKSQIILSRYMYRDVISEMEKGIKETEIKMTRLKNTLERGQFFGSITDRQEADIVSAMNLLGNSLAEQEMALNVFKGVSEEQAIERARFRRMNKDELELWITDEKNAGNQFIDIAKKVLEEFQKVSEGGQGEGEGNTEFLSKAYNNAKSEWEKQKKLLDEINKDRSKYQVKEYEDAVKAEKTARENYEKLGGVTGKAAIKAAKDTMKIQQDLKDSEIALMDESLKKELDKIEHNYDKRIKAIKGNSADEIKTRENLEKEKQRALDKYEADYNYSRDMKNLQNRLASAQKASQEELDLKLDILNEQKIKEIQEAEKTGEDVSLIEQKYAKLRIDIYDNFVSERIKLNSDISSKELNDLNNSVALEKIILSQKYRDGKISKEKYEEESNLISKNYSQKSSKIIIDAYQEQIKQIELLLETTSDLSDEKIKELRKKIANLKSKITDITISVNVDEGDSSEKLDKLRDRYMDAVRSITEASSEFGSGFEPLFDSLNDFVELGIKDFGKLWDAMSDTDRVVFALNALSNLMNGLTKTINNLYDNRIDRLDEESEALQKSHDEEIERIERLEETGAISKETAETRKRAAENDTAANEAVLEAKRAQLQTRQAKLSKANSMMQITINTAIAIMRALADLGPIAGPIAAALVGAMGAAQLALVAATPIPKYAKGTKDHQGGAAIVGDGGRSETVILPSGKSWITPAVPTLIDIPKGTVVLPKALSLDDLRNFRSDSLMIERGKQEGIYVNVNNDNSVLEHELKDIKKLLKNQSVQQRKAAYNAAHAYNVSQMKPI